MYGINEVTFASKKYITLNITELESLDFPRILRQNYNTWKIFSSMECHYVKFDDFCMMPGQLEIILWVKMLGSSIYTLRISCFYEWKLWKDTLFKIPTWNSLTFPWHLPLFRISLTSFQIPWQFPDLEKMKFSLTFPWRVATLWWFTW